ncbi:hypothetical protein J1N35_018105 [Gossypium stocksii]|uniref:Uncharacterized protein n=1 Tax=Gossypium stocksii TaxID=47602 RepID=A0A9D4A6C8_9ROSI|nr:hypothetical protein J1N35_018105 [Gossypium stocksii]
MLKKPLLEPLPVLNPHLEISSMKVVSFNTPHLLCLDPVSMLDRQIAELTNGLATWGSEKEDDGRERNSTQRMDPKMEPQMVEAVVLVTLEKFFKSVLNMLEVERKFVAVVDAALEAHLNCPQLYLYSTADKVVPYSTVPLSLLSKPQQM